MLAQSVHAARDHGPIGQTDLAFALARQHAHQIGVVHRIERMILQRAFVERHLADEQLSHDRRCGRSPGNAGVTSTIASPDVAVSASITGPILPASVELNVEQILNST